MTRIFLLFSLIVVSQLCFAQVTTTPLLPVDNLPVTITFDATKGTAGLKDYVGDVFAATVVIVNFPDGLMQLQAQCFCRNAHVPAGASGHCA